MQRVRHVGRALALILLLGCTRSSEPAPELADYLYKQSGNPSIDSWRLSHDEWNRTVVEPYRALYGEYVRAFDLARPTLLAQLANKHPIVTRAHVAGDPVATREQAITRWALPTLAATRVAELAGAPAVAIDAVFVDAGGQWRAIVGVGAIVRARVAAVDPTCATALDAIEPAGGRCIEATWAVADAALREDRPRFAHACGLAANLCGKPAP